jgi:hypothetical protein
VRRELKLREPVEAPVGVAVAVEKDVIPANLLKDRVLVLPERVPLEQVPRELELVPEAEVSIPAGIRARALKAPKPAQAARKPAAIFRAVVLKVVRRADKVPVAEKAVTKGSKLKDRRCRVGRKAVRGE